MNQRDWVIEEGDLVVYRASVMGACIRSLVGARLGEAPTPPGVKLQAALDRSSEAEEEAIIAFERQTGQDVLWQQKRVELDAMDKLIIRGHIDGLAQVWDDIVEVKNFGTYLFEKYDRGGLDALGSLGIQYRWQGAIYGHATDRKVRFVVRNKDSLDEEQIIIEPAVAASQLVPLGEILERINQVENYAALEEYPDCDRGCSRGSAYSHIHVFPDIAMGDAELESKLVRYHNISESLRELEDAKKILGDEIKREYAAGTHVAGEYKMQIVHAKGTRLDTKALKKDMPEVYEAYQMPNPVVRLTVSRTGGDSGQGQAQIS